MRRLFRWIAGLVSVAALAKLLSGRRHRHDATSEAPASTEPDPADELRRKLAEVRAAAPADEAPADATVDADAVASASEASAAPGDVPADDAPALTIEERRAAIHARAQEAIEAMKGIEP